MDPLISPHVDDIVQAVSSLYEAFDATQIMPDIFVCTCPVCVDVPDTLKAMQSIAPKDWPVALIVQYSNSAHGIPDNHDHLRAILPRCLEIIAADEMIDFHGVGTELLRFGDAWRQDPAFLNTPQVTALRRWLDVMMDHFIWLDGTEDGAIHSAEHLVEMFLVADWPLSDLRTLVTSKMDQPRFVGGLARWLTHKMIGKPLGYAPDIYALQYLPSHKLDAFFEWINDPQFADMFADWASAPDAEDAHDYTGQVAARRLSSC